MKIHFLILLFFIPLFGNAQNSTEEVRRLLDESLREYVQKIHPPKGCECNACGHTYTKGYKITKHQEVAGVLRVFGMAKVQYKSPYKAGNGVIEFYAEFRKEAGETILVRLRWRKDKCMKYETLYELPG